MTKFQAGQTGNPAGRPKGSKDSRTELRNLLAPHAEKLIKTCVNLALAGDASALRICMDRLVAPIREHRLSVKIPKIQDIDDCIKAQAAMLNAASAGEMLPSEAKLISELIEAQRRAYETGEVAKRLEAIEAELNQKGIRT